MTDTTSAIREALKIVAADLRAQADNISPTRSAHPAPFMRDCADRIEAALTAPAQADALYEAIKHGDQEHRAWLKEALDNWFAGKPIPAPRSAPAQADIHATTDDAIQEVEAAFLMIDLNSMVSEKAPRSYARLKNAIAAMRRVAHSPTPPRVDEKEMKTLLETVVRNDCVKDYPESPACSWPDCLCRGEVLQPRIVLAFGRALMEKCK